MSNTKAALRKQFGHARRVMGLPERHWLLAAMLGQLEKMAWPTLKTGFSYKPLQKNNEVPVAFFESWVDDNLGPVNWAYPHTILSENRIRAIADDEDTQWRTSSMGIEEPVAGRELNPEVLDIIWVPLLAYDESGHRVGYGKGLYDRFLKQCRPDALTIGLSWFDPVPIIADINPNDVSLKYCVSPYHLYVF
jgi:5-formyltetrahydrofolate cyclo-ligase